SAVSETAYELGAVLGTALLGGILTAWYRTALVVPADVPAELAAHAEETLAGARNAADDLGRALGASLRAAAAAAVEGGVTTTSLIGAGLVVLAALIAATTLRGSRQAPHEWSACGLWLRAGVRCPAWCSWPCYPVTGSARTAWRHPRRCATP